MESLVDSQHGSSTLLAGIAIVLCLHLFLKISEFLWNMAKKKSDLSDLSIEKLTVALNHSTSAIEKLEHEIISVKKDIAQIPRFKHDLRRAFMAIRIISGEKWPKIREELMEIEFPDV